MCEARCGVDQPFAHEALRTSQCYRSVAYRTTIEEGSSETVLCGSGVRCVASDKIGADHHGRDRRIRPIDPAVDIGRKGEIHQRRAARLGKAAAEAWTASFAQREARIGRSCPILVLSVRRLAVLARIACFLEGFDSADQIADARGASLFRLSALDPCGCGFQRPCLWRLGNRGGGGDGFGGNFFRFGEAAITHAKAIENCYGVSG